MGNEDYISIRKYTQQFPVSIKVLDHESIDQKAIDTITTFLIQNYPVKLDWSNNGLKLLILIESEKYLIGVLAIVPYDYSTKVHINVLAIDARWRRKGLGRQMLQHVVSMYHEKEITLNVKSDRPDLMKFYCGEQYAKVKKHPSKENDVYTLILNNTKYIADIPLPGEKPLLPGEKRIPYTVTKRITR